MISFSKISILVILIMSLNLVSAAYTGYGSSGGSETSFMNYYSGSAGQGLGNMYSTYWPQIDDKESCKARQDIILQVAPASCQPSVVRSDLIAEQNVPVFCQINAMQLNPLIDVKEISNIRFTSAKYPDGVIGAGFHPAKAALRTRETLLGDPLVNNVGYVAVVLKRNANESSLPDFVNVTLRAQVQYDSGNAFGVGRYEFILEEMSDQEWSSEKNKQSFFRGNYFIRLERAEPEYALLSVYSGDKRLYTFRVDRGKTLSDIYLPGFYCQVALQFQYTDFEAAREKARLEVSDEKGTETFDVYKGSTFLDSRCSVRDISIGNENGNVTIKCNNNNQILLEKKPRSLGYVQGELVSYIPDMTKPNVIVKDVQISNVLDNGKYILIDKDKSVEVEGSQLISKTQKKNTSPDKQYESDAEEVFNEAIAAYEKVADDFPAEIEKTVSKDTLGEISLRKAIELAKTFGKSETEFRLLNKLLEKYPQAFNTGDQTELDYLSRVDTSSSTFTIYLDGRYRTIRLVDLSLPKKASKASISLVDSNNRNFDLSDLKYGEETKITSLKEVASVKFSKINGDSSTFEFKCNDKSTRSVTLSLDSTSSSRYTICKVDYNVKLQSSDVEKVARININPMNLNTVTETNLTVGIGIEKRAIKLNPEKTKDKIAVLNETVKKWESISNKLGNVVTGLKTACLATAGILTAKNFLTGASGAAMARQTVMQDVWNKKCQDLVSKEPEKYKSLDDCFRQNVDAIEGDVKAMTSVIENQNKNIGKLISNDSNTNSGGLFGSDKIANYDKVGAGFMPTFKADMEKAGYGNFANSISLNDYNNGTISYDQLKQLDSYAALVTSDSSSPESKELAKQKIEKISDEITKNQQTRKAYEESLKATSGVSGVTNIVGDRNSKEGVWTGATLGSGVSDGNIMSNLKSAGLTDSSKISKVYDSSTGATYIVELNENAVSAGGCYGAGKVFDNKGNKVSDALAKDIRNKYSCFKKYDAAAYMNKYENPEIRYYETEPYKGVPSVVPVDLNEGWYAGVKKDYGLLGAKKSIDSSGAVASFWLCNVGPNKREEFKDDSFGDDICKRFDFYTGQVLEDFPGISDASKVKSLVSRSVNALKDAQTKYKSGIKTVNINGVGSVKVGNPAVAITGSNCQQFMSASDCQIMFNVCDPVICPNSRCDLGGTYPVQDVIQSGIIGSIMLCLPNAKEGIYVPICLTGLKAGIDSYLSVLKAHKDCLQANVDSGQMIGICDQIYSIYMCDFFWRQIAPAVNILIPKIIESTVYGRGQSERGGGEYMTVMFAWENARKSIDYFTQSYASNSFKAFNLRSTEEVGSQFCKSFISARGPSTFKNLVAADSPTQFYASFDSVSYSTVTVPATAQYKVFYHIFAGNDAGTYYSIYLKDPPSTTYYSATPTVQVASGFIAKGQTADETKDFTAPEGYKQLCVRINDEEECGFKQVTTSFGINYLKDSLASNEITTSGIKTEDQCVSGAGLANGNANALALVNTNLQSGVQEATSGNVYERGIVRVCATDNPASSTNPARYVQVGYCSSDNRIKCWLDKNSVENAITDNNLGVKNATLEELKAINNAYLSYEGKLMNVSEFNSRFLAISEKVKKLISTDIDSKEVKNIDLSKVNSVVTELDDLILNADYLVFNNNKAQLLKMKGEVKDALARAYLKKVAQQVVKPVDPEKVTPVPSVNPTSNPDTSTPTYGNGQIEPESLELSSSYSTTGSQTIKVGGSTSVNGVSINVKKNTVSVDKPASIIPPSLATSKIIGTISNTGVINIPDAGQTTCSTYNIGQICSELDEAKLNPGSTEIILNLNTVTNNDVISTSSDQVDFSNSDLIIQSGKVYAKFTKTDGSSLGINSVSSIGQVSSGMIVLDNSLISEAISQAKSQGASVIDSNSFANNLINKYQLGQINGNEIKNCYIYFKNQQVPLMVGQSITAPELNLRMENCNQVIALPDMTISSNYKTDPSENLILTSDRIKNYDKTTLASSSIFDSQVVTGNLFAGEYSFSITYPKYGYTKGVYMKLTRDSSGNLIVDSLKMSSI